MFGWLGVNRVAFSLVAWLISFSRFPRFGFPFFFLWGALRACFGVRAGGEAKGRGTKVGLARFLPVLSWRSGGGRFAVTVMGSVTVVGWAGLFLVEGRTDWAGLADGREGGREGRVYEVGILRFGFGLFFFSSLLLFPVCSVYHAILLYFGVVISTSGFQHNQPDNYITRRCSTLSHILAARFQHNLSTILHDKTSRHIPLHESKIRTVTPSSQP